MDIFGASTPTGDTSRSRKAWIVELESLTLSRDIPYVFKPLVRPLVDRVARESIRRTLESLRARLTATAATL